MRNLKKALSLALALVMLLGLMVMGAGAAEINDIDSIEANNLEAVKVMNAIDIIKGDENGDFNPTGTLKRAEAAVIISKVLMTPALVEKLSAAETRFDDVTNYEGGWAIPYVEACAVQQVILGDDEHTFAPAREVSGIEFAAMLLRVLGIDNGQFTNWPFDWQKAALEAELDANGVNIYAEQLSRADAAQMAFNALLYSPTGSTWMVGDVEFDNFNDAAMYAAIMSIGSEPVTPEKAAAKDSLAVTRFKLSEDEDTDAYGRTVKTWKVEGVEDAIYTATESKNKPVKTYTSNVASGTVAKDLPTGTGKYSFDSEKNITINGAESDAAIGAENIEAQIGNGKIVEVYATNKTVNKVIVIDPQLVTVSAVDTKKNTFTLSNGKKIDEDSDFAALIGTVEKGDKLVCVSNSKAVLDLYVPDTVTGTMTFRDSKTGAATIDGQSVAPCKGYTISSSLVKEDVVAYMINGYAALVEEPGAEETPSNVGDGYIWVTNIWSDKASAYDNTQVAYVMGVLANGEVATLKLGNPESDGSVGSDWKDLPADIGNSAASPAAGKAFTLDPDSVAMANAASANKLVAGLYYYYTGTGTNAGKALLTKVADGATVDIAGNGTTAVNTTQPKIGADFISANVTMVWFSGKGDTLTGSLTGREAIAADKSFSCIYDENGRIAVIFVDAGAKTSENVVYIAASSGTAAFINGKDKKDSGYRVTYYAHGSENEDTMIVKGYTVPGFYTITENGEGYTAKAYSTNVVAEQLLASTALYNGYLDAKGDGNLVNIRNALVIDLRGGDEVVSTVEQLQELVEDTALLTKVSLIAEPDNTAKAVYVVETKAAVSTPAVDVEDPADEGEKSQVTTTPEQGGFQIEIPEDKENECGYDVTITHPDGDASIDIDDWGDPATTKGFVVYFEKGSQAGCTITFTLTKRGADEPTWTEDSEDDLTNAKGYVFYVNPVDHGFSEAGIYDWTITSTDAEENETELDKGFFEMKAE